MPIVSMETRIMCLYVYHTAVLVPRDPLHSYLETSLAGVRYISPELE